MLEDYKQTQSIAYKTLINSGVRQKISHAYLIKSNGYPKKLDFAIALSKFLLCPKNNSTKKNCGECKICHKIDSNNFTELKIIEPSGLWIKKEQLEELQNEFSKKAIDSDKKIYIINGAEKMNLQAANSILKFLEEPEPNIIAILITDNVYQLISTIRSRCQIISLQKGKEQLIEKLGKNEKMIYNIAVNRTTSLSELESNIEDCNYIETINNSVEFINAYEKSGQAILLDINKLWHQNFKDKEQVLLGMDISILYYKDILNKKLGRKVEIFNIDYENMDFITNKNTEYQLCSKIKLLIDTKEKIKFNANINLLIDKLIFQLEGVSQCQK